MKPNHVPRFMEVCGHTFIANCIDGDSIIVDLGANVGSFTEKMHSIFGCSVFAVEPVPQLFSKIKVNERVRKFNYCIAGKNEPMLLNIPVDKCASIYQPDIEKSSGSIVTQGITFPSFLKAQNIKAIDLLKIDIEGAELELFSSLETEHLRMIKQVTVEFHDFLWKDMHDQVELIKQRMISGGFVCVKFSLNNGNVLFVKKEVMTNATHFYMTIFKYAQGVKRVIKRRVFFKKLRR